MSSETLRVLVIGGGVAGCAAGILLSRGGAAVDLVEQQASVTALGSGITLQGNALRVLRELRVLDETHQEMISKGLNPRLDVPGLVQMAKVCDELGGDPQRAEALLVEVGDLLGRPDLERDDRVRGTIALAAGYAAHKDSETAWKHFRAALTGARDQGNGRPRHMMLTDLCVAIGRCRYSLPADVSRALEQEWKRQGPPW